MLLILTALVVLALLVINEFWWRWRTVHGEMSRKFIHISVGCFVATWPFFLSWRQIQFLSIAFLIIVCLSKYFKLFQAIHSVQRPTWGEIFFAASVGLITLITQDKWIYAAALLQMALADGLAAIIGVQFGNRRRYQVTGHPKTVIGTLTFFAVSFAILLAYSRLSGTDLPVNSMVMIGILASLIENLATRGLDNLLVPVLVALLLANY
ncbi:MAG: hypothetical protein AAB436_01990 [Patescibacteria group bacterium]